MHTTAALPARGTADRSASSWRGIATRGAYPRAWGCSFAFSRAPTPGVGVLTLPITAWPPWEAGSTEEYGGLSPAAKEILRTGLCPES